MKGKRGEGSHYAYPYKADSLYICAKSIPSSDSTDFEVTSNIHVAGL